MNYLKYILFTFLVCAISTRTNAQVISVDDDRTAENLVNDVLVNSSCVAISNVSVTGDTFSGGKNSYAYFSSNNGNFPFKEGVLLSTWSSQNSVGPFVSNLGDGDSDWLGDANLDQALGITSINATVLEFDFVPLTNFFSFNYIFASNEYQYFFPCSYSDGFAFLIKEADKADDTYQNVAVIPNTNTVVSSTNVRPKIEPGNGINGNDPYPGCPAVNAEYFQGLNNSTNSPINYAGQTVVMTAQSNVIAGTKYHIKLVIADDSQIYYDSAVFLEAGSFKPKIDFGPDRTALSNNPLCSGENFVLDTNMSPAYSYKWYKDNVLISGANTPTYTPTESGTYKVEVTLTPSLCESSGEIKIDFSPEIQVTNTTLVQCDIANAGTALFNLTKVDDIVKNNNSDILHNGYYESLADAETKTNVIANPESYTAANKTIYARLENQYACYKIAEVALEISNDVIPNQNPIQICDQDAIPDGLYEINLSTEVSPNITGVPSGLNFIYYANENDALTETNQLPNLFKNSIPNAQTIYARALNGTDCYGVVAIELVINTFDPPGFNDETLALCKDDSMILSVDSGFVSYLWNTGATSNSIPVSTIGDYTVTVSDANGCEKTKNFKLVLSEPATITNAIIKDFSANDNSILVEYTGAGNYEFSLDGTVFQADSLFINVSPGIYNVVARDKNNCGLSNIYVVYVLDYPRFFTPNGDNYNDVWYIKNLNLISNSTYTISIFDRFGKLVKQMNNNSSGWNGLYNNQQLPADDYWFSLLFNDGKNVKGHFSLKR
ncbi:T9SS type B sorting domain-containing protein [Flavobacterium sp. GA093]|uniref:T9SS type B sorting domain-containing protein n=1 Tax=Flavobacterium hydrocarbonoxydans TaxID=2683249 RepID=A0A6I4NSJ9_9FLAO|nr:choice-of-anchor L domain-containing protein [Flavobacterium hydrocarbonoxydans]MWB96002.1 T9SS type B sorting domain-containing protein [Flavobacterium hydrocarbonoxydans]